ncbi:MAG: bifunctional phosphoglucose/phosphomannose isomerase [Anaerolineaceae bacterium]|nr:bifunctional phosphoglucose/phosphomannose isomerase [Anaerolineaceae bacterium]
MHEDEQGNLNKLDPENMLSHIKLLPEQFHHAWKLGNELPLPTVKGVSQVLIAGMGGSAIGGDLLANYVKSSCTVPVFSHRDYGLPAWAKDEHTLVICSSHSGNTEETLSAFDSAIENGCSIMTLSTGGKLAEKAKNAGVTAWVFDHEGQPRTAIGYSFGLLLALFARLGLVNEKDEIVQGAIRAMKSQQGRIGNESGLSVNPAKRLAGQLYGRYVSIFAAGEFEVVARRWKTQINELAKAWAQFEGLPETDHNTLAGLENPEEQLEKVAAIFLTAKSDYPRNALRIKFTKQKFMLQGLGVDEVKASGDSRLAEMWTLLHFGDYVSYYLALMYQVDPTPVATLSELKKFLSSQQEF